VQAASAFTAENRVLSWWHVCSSFAVLMAVLVGTALVPWWPLRIVGTVLEALMLVRVFVLYHDYMHGAILGGSKVGGALFHCFGMLFLSPPRSWRQSHNFHHGHVGQIAGSSTGSFPLFTTEMWAKASRTQRLQYRISRHPLTFALAYLTVFLISITLLPLLQNARRHWDSAVAIAAHATLIAMLWIFAGFLVVLHTCLLPMLLAAALGAYLFYAQHNYVGMNVLSAEQWGFQRAALESSSYMRLGPIMRRFTGNIGYHHVHHLNPHIPFYRLPEAMAKVPEFQRAAVTTLSPRDVFACLRLKVWDPVSRRMLGYREATAAARQAPAAESSGSRGTAPDGTGARAAR
jgi:omega-6 fatty acid desaturase (delta-12 desaturase)